MLNDPLFEESRFFKLDFWKNCQRKQAGCILFIERALGCFQSWSWKDQWHPTPVLLPGKSHGRRSLVGCSPWGHEESDTTERLHFHFSLSCIGEGNGNLLQCSCLENPRDGAPGGLSSVGSHRVGHN